MVLTLWCKIWVSNFLKNNLRSIIEPEITLKFAADGGKITTAEKIKLFCIVFKRENIQNFIRVNIISVSCLIQKMFRRGKIRSKEWVFLTTKIPSLKILSL
jgi:hypothetical protein